MDRVKRKSLESMLFVLVLCPVINNILGEFGSNPHRTADTLIDWQPWTQTEICISKDTSFINYCNITYRIFERKREREMQFSEVFLCFHWLIHWYVFE